MRLKKIMKKPLIIISSMTLILFAAVLMLISTSSGKGAEETALNHFYSGQGDSWLATYSVTRANSSIYSTLTIQYLFDQDEMQNEAEKIGPIEYQLKLSDMKIESSFPQELRSLGSLHIVSRMNADFFSPTSGDSAELTVSWQGKTEKLQLEAIN